MMGYELVDDDCHDIDECATMQAMCPNNSECVNNDGSYSCICNVGYHMNKYNDQCKDVDECKIKSEQFIDSLV